MVDISERRLVLRMLARWSDLKEERTFPAAAEMDSAAVGEDWRFCALLALQEDLAASRFLHVGSALDPVRADGADLTVAGLPSNTLLGAAAASLDWMLRRRVPLSLGGELDTGRGLYLYRYILLPLSDDGDRIDHALIAVNGRPMVVDETPK